MLAWGRGSFRWGLLAAVAGAVGCSGGTGGQYTCPAMPVSCPATVPTDGAPCAGETAGPCEYGDDVLGGCNTAADCYAGVWSVSAPLTLNCPTVLSSICPSSFAEAQAPTSQPACASYTARSICHYPEGSCTCGGGLVLCTPPAAGCPATRPRAGTPCSTGPGGCAFWGTGSCDGASMTCACGVWQLIYCVD
jgi:hypothetical protein